MISVSSAMVKATLSKYNFIPILEELSFLVLLNVYVSLGGCGNCEPIDELDLADIDR